MKRRPPREVNLLTLTPVQAVPWEPDENDFVVLLAPKFRNRLVVRWILPRLPKPNVRVTMDEVGSFVWRLCDGTTTVGTIVRQLGEKFGQEFDPTHDRIAKFFLHLERERLIRMVQP
jgi:hypothetical protein